MSDQYTDARDGAMDNSNTGEMPAVTENHSADVTNEVLSEAPLETQNNDSMDIAESTENSNVLENDLEADHLMENSETASGDLEAVEIEPGDFTSDIPDRAVEDSTGTTPDTPLPEGAAEIDESAAAETVSDTTDKDAEDSAMTTLDTALTEETVEINKSASSDTVNNSTDKAVADSAETTSDAALPEETTEINESASNETVSDSSDNAVADNADIKTDAPLPEETTEINESSSAGTVSDSADKAAENSTDTTPDTALPAEAAKTGADTADEAVGDTTDVDNPSEVPKRDEEEPINSNSEDTDVQSDASVDSPTDIRSATKPASDMVTPEEYSQYKDIYHSLDKLNVSQEYKDALRDKFTAMDTDLKGVYNTYANQLNCNDTNYQDTAYFASKENGFKLDQGYDLNNPLGPGNTYFHESAHMIDWLKGQEGGQGEPSYGLDKTVQQDCDDTIARISLENNCDTTKAKEILTRQLAADPVASNIVSDVFGGVTKNEVYTDGLWVHDTDYWNKGGSDALRKETFAGITADRACGNTKSLAFTKSYMPKTMEAYDNAIKSGGRL